MTKLTPRDRQFIEELTKNRMNTSRTLSLLGYKDNSILSKPAVKKALAEVLKAATLNELQVMQRLSELATIDASELIDENGKINAEAFQRLGHLVKGIKPASYDRDGKMLRGPEIVLHDSASALDKVAKALNLYRENEVNVENNTIELVIKSPVDI